MKFKSFIGIDVSKSTLDVYLKNGGYHSVFSNDKQGFEAMIEWVMDRPKQNPILFSLTLVSSSFSPELC